MKRAGLATWVLMIIVATVFPGCASEDAPDTGWDKPAKEIAGIKLVDIEGRRIELKKKAERIVDLTGLSGTRILIQLDAAQYIVGMTDAGLTAFDPESNTYHPAQRAFPSMVERNVANIGNWKEPNAEKIIALNPDVILVGWGGGKARKR